ncbi:MAG: tyrosine--tRNA ligase [Defluviitaleaceae bacterium]|nr:tyrosine--tRNA ligase [Defluviitaleaceae bacterium]
MGNTKNAYELLQQRGFIEQCTHEEQLRDLMDKEQVTFYIGYDPTADSLTAGHFMTLMALSHMQKAGHKPIVLMGGGTGMVGDPTDRTEMRRVMSVEELSHNVACFKKQLSRFITFGEGSNDAVMVNNADWLCALSYLPFIREYAVHFSVNRMLAAETYKSRIDIGLTFFEMNYMIMQAYDFLHLFREKNCRLQIGGSEQWSNIIAGVELIRKTEAASAYGFTMTILTTADGSKMGKTAGNAVWLDAAKTSPYEFYQYWRNTDDSTVLRNLKLLTFLSVEEIDAMQCGDSAGINRSKEILAYEVTKTVHGKEEADKAMETSRSLFAGAGSGATDAMPFTEITASELSGGINIVMLLEKAALIESRSDARRLIQQGGITAGGKKITDFEHKINESDFNGGELIIQKGKKIFHRIIIRQKPNR